MVVSCVEGSVLMESGGKSAGALRYSAQACSLSHLVLGLFPVCTLILYSPGPGNPSSSIVKDCH